MEITVSIPDKFVPAAEVNGDVSRQMLEAYAIENYRQGTMGLGRIAELLDLCIDETNALLKEHKIPLNYDLEDLALDRRTIEMFLKK